ncbi:cytochrome C biogenesis protein [Tardiphaga alba]|uniref:Cytochrome C biogenesis protein n=1 Tax=Tardiphaga alba TaxID=340268 RepID=A0ABX8AFK7_9BRAD|nr:protein-disulfide reductase DsbD domain-containing protein [Tardiphaga alba]QUS41404.1 cytochrome C biogenesis protein [Tardiphaga alba]
MITSVPHHIVAACIAGALLTSAARAEDASPWQRDTHSQIRLVAGSRSGPVMLGGIAIHMQPGWHTYWRNPGDSGVPPRFDFSKSDNLDSITILWPAPMKFDDGAGGQSLGYEKQVLLPMRVVAKDAGKPVVVRAAISYAVCEKLCVPVEANAELAFTSVASTEDAALTAALDTVPKPATLGDNGTLTVRDVKRDGKNVFVDVVAPDGSHPNLFVEGPTAEWALPIPKLEKASPAGLKRFGFELDGLPSGATADGAALKLTLVGQDKAYEYTVTLP